MLPQRCPNCICAEEAGVPLSLQMRLQRSMRLVTVSLVLLLGIALATLVLLLFGLPAHLPKSEQSPSHAALTATRAEKQSSSHPSILLTLGNQLHIEWHGVREGGNMKYGCQNLSIPSKGLYRVYVQVTFHFLSNTSDDENCANKILDLNVVVKHCPPESQYKGCVTLLHSQETMNCSHDWTKSVFTSGTFELEAGSQLHVDFTPKDRNLTRRKSHETTSFFGVDLISTNV